MRLNLTCPSGFSQMEKQVLRLVRNGRMFYVPSQLDYETLRSMGTPLLKIDLTELPLLKSRCRKRSVQIQVREFEAFEQLLFKKIQHRWKFPIIIKGNLIHVDIPRKKSLYPKAEILVDAIQNFYSRHLFDVEVKVRKFSKKMRFTLERTFNGKKEPEWKVSS